MPRVDVTVPAYGMTESNSYLLEWLVEPGATVDDGAPLLVLETSKAETEIVAPVGGTVGDLLVEAETEIPPGTVLTWIDSEDS